MNIHRLRAAAFTLALTALPLSLQAQWYDEEPVQPILPSSSNVAIAFRGGTVISTPRGTFPSVIIGTSRYATGSIAQSLGTSAAGMQADLSLLIPFNPSLGLSTAFGTQVIVASHHRDSGLASSKFYSQILTGALGVQWSFLNYENSYGYGGLRAVYFDGGIDVMLAGIANRLESIAWRDTASGPEPGVGSFETNEPLRNLVGLHGGVGMRFAATPEIELLAEASYSFALNPMFSGETLSDNDFTVDRFSIMAGVGYRF